MICPYCAQWNPDGAVRCCFCHNATGDGEDRTANTARTTLPPQASGATFAAHRPRPPAGIEALPVWKVVAGVLGAFVVIVALKCVLG